MILKNLLANASFTRKSIFSISLILISTLLAISIYTFITSLLAGGIPPFNQPFLQGLQCVQGLFTFILPSVALAYLFSSSPTQYLHINKAPQTIAVFLTIGCMLVSIPLMNLIISWNESLVLPNWLAGVESWMKAKEIEAKTVTDLLLNTRSIGGLFINILLIGVIAGVGEEFLFRGIIQRLIQDKTKRTHAAIWITAILFSAIHLQFYGFFPRMLLGAFFGYLVVWSGNLWLPVIAHFFNNAMGVTFDYLQRNGIITDSSYETFGADGTTWWASIASLAIFCLLLHYLRKNTARKI